MTTGFAQYVFQTSKFCVWFSHPQNGNSSNQTINLTPQIRGESVGSPLKWHMTWKVPSLTWLTVTPKPNKVEKMPKYIKYLVCIQGTGFRFAIISQIIAVFASPNDSNLLNCFFFKLWLSTKGIDALKGCPALERVEENCSEEPWSAFPRWSDVLMHTCCAFDAYDILWHTKLCYSIYLVRFCDSYLSCSCYFMISHKVTGNFTNQVTS